MVTVELLYRPNWNINLFFKKFKVERHNSGCLEDYLYTAENKEIKKRYPYFLQRSAKSMYSKCKSFFTGVDNYANEKKETENQIWHQMNLMISHNGLSRLSNNNCEDILVNYLGDKDFENQVKTLSAQFKEKFDVSLMGGITFFSNDFIDEYKIIGDKHIE